MTTEQANQLKYIYETITSSEIEFVYANTRTSKSISYTFQKPYSEVYIITSNSIDGYETVTISGKTTSIVNNPKTSKSYAGIGFYNTTYTFKVTNVVKGDSITIASNLADGRIVGSIIIIGVI